MAETPLPFDDLVLVLTALENRALLVGGQAVAWWAYSYAERGRLAELTGRSMSVSGDVDYVNDGGRRELEPVLETLAKAVGGEIHHNEGGWAVPIVAGERRLRRQRVGTTASRLPHQHARHQEAR